MLEIKRAGPDANRATFVERTKPTSEQVQAMREKITALIEFAGGLTRFSNEIGIPFHTINSWKTRGKIPQYIAAEIGRIAKYRKAGFTREALRPDVSKWPGV